jgi:hypothetical protein
MVQPDSLIAVGGVLEAAGVFAVAADLWLTRREVKRFERRTKSIYLAGRSEGSSSASATMTGGREPTLQERLEALEKRVRQVEDDPEKRAQLQRRMELTAERWTAALRDDIEALIVVLRGVTTGGIPLRGVGVGFVMLGLGLSVAGSLLR